MCGLVIIVSVLVLWGSAEALIAGAGGSQEMPTSISGYSLALIDYCLYARIGVQCRKLGGWRVVMRAFLFLSLPVTSGQVRAMTSLCH